MKLHTLTRMDAFLAALAAVAGLALYIRTLAPDLLLGDSGEFQTLVYTLGMTHPTGYPVFVLLGRLFTLLPLGDLAWRANLFVAVLASITLACVYLSIRLLAGWRFAALTGTFSLAVTPLFWFYAVIAELYIPACAFTSAIILLLFLWRQNENPRFLFAAGLLGGLSLGVHSTVALIAPGIGIWLLVSGQFRKSWKPALFGASLGLFLALASFFFLDRYNAPSTYYNATVRHALSAWEMDPADFDSPVERLEFLYTGRQFNKLMFRAPAEVMQENGSIYLGILQDTFAPLTLALIGLGLLTVFISHWRERLLFLLAGGAQTLFALNYEVDDFYVFFIPSFVFLAFWAGIGLGKLLDGIGWGARRLLKGQKPAFAASALVGAIVLGLSIQFWSEMLLTAWQDERVSFAIGTPLDEYPYPIEDPAWVHDDAEMLVNALEPDAILFTGWDVLYPYYFVAHVEHGKTGMAFHETYPQEGMNGLAESTADYVSASLSRPIYFQERPHGVAAARFAFKPVNKNGIRLYQVTGEKP
ncbi:MAG: DUF2723 domain-containing protein [Anaerolineae bacterium]|nr:DUF2723 domain-containing protein [Anaerolineae bacterium]